MPHDADDGEPGLGAGIHPAGCIIHWDRAPPKMHFGTCGPSEPRKERRDKSHPLPVR
jgi:hypothetical protein